MTERPRALIVRTAGTNCDQELIRAFEMAGATPDVAHVDALIADPGRVASAPLIGLPGGFSYGDDVASGRLLAARVRERLLPAMRSAVEAGAAVIGVCNGFQVLVQAGLLPGFADQTGPEVALVENASARFIDRWAPVEVGSANCVWTEPLRAFESETTRVLPIAHGEGRFVALDTVLGRLEAEGHVALRYAEDVNGSADRIAGICDSTGRVFGLMPHPERYLDWNRHPAFTRLAPDAKSGDTPGLAMFRAAVESVMPAAAE
ncbi:MAG: phosphoribosylformylglycinamidine synthase subunit PurQ [Planctomycetota bacterium]